MQKKYCENINDDYLRNIFKPKLIFSWKPRVSRFRAIGGKLSFADKTLLRKHYMNKRILVLTGQESNTKGTFIWQHIKSLKDINDSILGIGVENEFDYLLCILEVSASVQEIRRFAESVKKFYSLPICVFEKNIIESYPGEKWKIKGMIDILIRKSFTQREFFLLIDRVLGLEGEKESVSTEKKVETVGENGIIRIYPYKRKLYINDIKINLTRKEFDIFYYLFEKKGDVVSHKELYERVWKREYIHDDTNIMAHIHRLRGKVEKDPKNPKYICNQYGIGYYFGGLYQEALPTL